MLRALGVDSYAFTATGPQARVDSPLSKEHERTIIDERRRLAAAMGGS